MTTVVTKDAVWKRIRRESFQNWEVLVGIPSGAVERDGTSTAAIGAILHDGTDDIPARPFLSRPLDGRNGEVKRIMARTGKAVLEGKLSAGKAIDLLGLWSRNRVIAAIDRRGEYEENAESTIERKRGGDQPLVNWGQLKGSISWIARKIGAASDSGGGGEHG